MVWARAQGRCEYCGIHERDCYYSHEADHIIPEKHGGETVLENLALSCFFCNRYKGTDLASIDPETGALTPFYNPRIQSWNEHFQINRFQIIPLTPEGRVTSIILKFNDPKRILERKLAANQ